MGVFTTYGVLFGKGTAPLGVTAAGAANEVLRVPAAGGAPAFGALDLSQAATVTGLLPVAHGGSGTATPSLVAGTGIEITGSWPNQTVTNTSPASALGDPVTVAHGGTGTATGSITGTGALTFAAGGSGQHITLTPSGYGFVILGNAAFSSIVQMVGPAGAGRLLQQLTGTLTRWASGADSVAESGANAGSNFIINRYDDAGAWLGYGLYIRRSDGQVGIGNEAPGKALDVTGDVRASLQLISTVATGTAPLAVTSTTEVPNLRAATATDLAAGSILAVAKGGWGSADGSYAQTMKPTVASGTPHVDCLTSGESQPTVRLQRRAILFGPGGDVAPHIQLYHPIPFFVRLREYSDDPAQNEALVFAIDAHATAGKEATLCLHRGEEANGEYLDISNNGYSTDSNYHFVIQKRGTGSFRPFVFQFSDGTTVTDSFHVLTSPLGVVQFAQPVQVLNVAEYADNAAAVAAGLAVGTLYRTADVVKIVH